MAKTTIRGKVILCFPYFQLGIDTTDQISCTTIIVKKQNSTFSNVKFASCKTRSGYDALRADYL